MPTSLILTCPAAARTRTVARTGPHRRRPFCRWKSARHDRDTRFPAAFQRRLSMFAVISVGCRPAAASRQGGCHTGNMAHDKARQHCCRRAPATLTSPPKASWRRRDGASLSLHNTNKSLKAARGRYWIRTPEEHMNDRDEFLRDRLRPEQPGARAARLPGPPHEISHRLRRGLPSADSAATAPSHQQPARPAPPRRPPAPSPGDWSLSDHGWRRMVRLATFGLINPGPSAARRQDAQFEAAIRTVLRGTTRSACWARAAWGKPRWQPVSARSSPNFASKTVLWRSTPTPPSGG